MNAAYMLKTVNADFTSHGGFRWPRRGKVVAPDWDPEPVCGGGLHGLLWGEGDGGLLDWSDDAVWLVCKIDADTAVDLGGKIKVPEATVAHAGTRKTATAFLAAHAPGRSIVGGTATAGHRGAATAGHGGTAKAGYGGTATAGYGGTATAGLDGTATAGYGGTATAGHDGTATAGDFGTATAGDGGTATAGYGGTATAGDGGTATAGHGGTATAGLDGTIVVRWQDGNRWRLAVGYIGEADLEPNVPYRCDDNGRLVRADGAK